MPQPQETGLFRFGVFEVETRTGILRKHGVRIRLQDQPFRVLLALLERPGDVVTREELQQRLGAGTVFGDFDHSLNIAINKIREALGDSAEAPRFVETLPRRGYRFVAPLEVGPVTPAAPVAEAPDRPHRRRRILLAMVGFASVMLVLALVAGAVSWLLPPTPQLELRRLTNDSSVKIGPVLCDGTRLYFRVPPVSGLTILQVPVSGGEPTRVPIVAPPGRSYNLVGLSPNGQELMVVSYDSGLSEGGPLWALRIADGSSRRIGSLNVRVAAYSPDGKQILFTTGGIQEPGALWVASSDGSDARRLLELKGLAFQHPCWSPDGSRIAFGQFNRENGDVATWEVMADGSGLRREYPDWGSGIPRWAGLRMDVC